MPSATLRRCASQWRSTTTPANCAREFATTEKGIAREVVEDQGRKGHWGLHGMRERAKLIGGKLEVWSSPHSDTEVELTIPASAACATPRM